MSIRRNTLDACEEYGVTMDYIYDLTGITSAVDVYVLFRRTQWGNEPDANYWEPDIIGALSDEAYYLGTYATRDQARAAMEG